MEFQGLELQKRIGAIDYVECSALSAKGIHYLFDVAIKTFMDEGIRKQEKENTTKCRCVVQ